jgi:hypothetical protein
MNPELAGELCDRLDQSLRGAESNLAQLTNNIVAVLKKGAWKERRIRTGKIVRCTSFVELMTAPPLHGFGEDLERVQALLKDDPDALRLFRAATTQHGGARTQNGKRNNRTLAPASRGTTRAYLLTRLEAEAPKLYADVLAGKCSAHAAAREAGIIKTKTPLEQLQRLWATVPPADRRTFLRWAKDEFEELDV